MHPTFSHLFTRTVVASGTVAAGRCITASGSIPTVLGQKVIGIARFDGKAGDGIAVDILGTALAKTGAAVAVDDDLTASADGCVVPITDAATQRTMGRALSAAENGRVCEVLLLPR